MGSGNTDIDMNGIGRAKNLNSNTDFTVAGMANASTKHVPRAVRRAGGGGM